MASSSPVPLTPSFAARAEILKTELDRLKGKKKKKHEVLEQLLQDAVEKIKLTDNKSTKKQLEEIIEASKKQSTLNKKELDDIEEEEKRIASQPPTSATSSTLLRQLTSSDNHQIDQLKYLYHTAIYKKFEVFMRIVRINYMGLPRSGKTSFRKRLMGEIANLIELAKENPSTGVAEDAGHLILRNLKKEVGFFSESSDWTKAEDLRELGSWFTVLLSCQLSEDKTSSSHSDAAAQPMPTSRLAASRDKFIKVPSLMFEPSKTNISAEKMESIIQELQDVTLLINTDTGGQSEFLDLHAALVSGPSLNLLFSRLSDELDSQFKIHYTNEEGVSTEVEDSTTTGEEVLFQTLSSIACFGGCGLTAEKLPERDDETEAMVMRSLNQEPYSWAPIVTWLPKRNLKRRMTAKIKNTKFFESEYAYENQLMITANNQSGDKEEIQGIRKILERVIERSFPKIAMPASWVILLLYIRKMGIRIWSLKDCEQQASKLNIDPCELQNALWCLHHKIGAVLYYPELEELKHTLICDVQLLYDSATNLIRNVFTFNEFGKAVSMEFKEKGQFSVETVHKAMSKQAGDLIPIEKLVKLLEFLNILCFMSEYFMPSVLKKAKPSELKVESHCTTDPAPLLIRYECGYVPVGVFPAMLANLISQNSKLQDWKMISNKIRKNMVRFLVGEDRDKVTLISHPRYFEIGISQYYDDNRVKSLQSVVRSVIKDTLHTVTKRMNYKFDMDYDYVFKCPCHPVWQR